MANWPCGTATNRRASSLTLRSQTSRRAEGAAVCSQFFSPRWVFQKLLIKLFFSKKTKTKKTKQTTTTTTTTTTFMIYVHDRSALSLGTSLYQSA